MKKIALIVIVIIAIVSCREDKDHGFNSEEESVASVLEKFPMIDKNLTSVRKIDLDSLSITLLRNPNKKAYDEVLVFEKKNKFYAIPFFSNMYADYWNFENDNQPKLFPITNSTFEKELSNLIPTLNVNVDEFSLLFGELMESVLHTETNLNNKLSLFKNTSFISFRVEKFKNEETDSCKKRTALFYDQLTKDYNNKQVMSLFQYNWDKKNGRVYKFENTSKNQNEIKFNIKTYRVDCYLGNISLY